MCTFKTMSKEFMNYLLWCFFCYILARYLISGTHVWVFRGIVLKTSQQYFHFTSIYIFYYKGGFHFKWENFSMQLVYIWIRVIIHPSHPKKWNNIVVNTFNKLSSPIVNGQISSWYFFLQHLDATEINHTHRNQRCNLYYWVIIALKVLGYTAH